jgi:hypothetical protein
MRYTYQANYADYKRALGIYIRSSPWRRFWFHLFYWGFGLIGTVLVATAWFGGEPRSSLRDVGLPLGAYLIVVGVIVLALRPWQLRRVYKMWNGEIRPDSVLYLEFDGPVMITGLLGSRETRFVRAGVCRVVDHQSMTLLFLSKKKFLYLSKGTLPPEAFEDLQVWLAQPGAPDKC